MPTLLLILSLFSLPAFAQAPIAEIKTNLGTIRVELNQEKAPITVANFLSYAKEGFYEGTIFHRVIKGFMIQGGGLTEKMWEKPTGAPIQNEAKNGLKNLKYTIAMAREDEPHTATAQFFINVADNKWLDQPEQGDAWGYAVFGKVIAGTEVVDQIEVLPTGTKVGYEDVPLTPVVIESVTVE